MTTAEVSIDKNLKQIEDQFYNADLSTLYERKDPNRELPRYMITIGNHLEEEDRRSFGSKTGGLWVGVSEVEGAPTMWRTRGFANCMQIVPLEKRAIPKKADHREEDKRQENYMTGDGVPAGTRGYFVYPGDNINFLKSDRFRPMGFLELEELIGVEWDSKIPIKAQLFFFKDFYGWLDGTVPFPVKLEDRLSIIKEAKVRAESSGIPNFPEMANTMLRSGQLFADYANSHIEKNRQIIMSLRSTNTGGFFVGWNGRSIAYARQLGIRLEDVNDIQGINYKEKEESTKAILEEMRRDRAINENRFLEMLEAFTLATIGKPIAIEKVQSSVDGPTNEVTIPEYKEEPDVSLGEIAEEAQPELVSAKVDEKEEVEKVKDPKPDGLCHFIKDGQRCNKRLIGAEAATRLYCNKCEKLVN